MAGIKIVDLPALGRDLISTDLLELSLAGGTGSRKITGQEIMNASKLSVGNTPIINGAVGQVLFQGTGNVLQESANLFWDNTNGRLGIGTSTPLEQFHMANTGAGTNTVLRMSVNPVSVNVISFRDTGGAEQGAILGTGAAFNFGTYRTLQTSVVGGGGGVGLRTGNGANAHISFYSGNAEANLSTETMRLVASTGNVLINTTTDAGYKLDVNGTGRFQNGIVVTNPSFTGQGSIAQTANNTTVITGRIAGSPENITFGPSNRIFINAEQTRFNLGSVQIGWTLTVGNPGFASSTNMLYVTGGITASSAIARGGFIDTTLTASANNDTLVGLDINPTFTNGAFTGVTQFFGRFANSNGGTSLPATTGTTQTGGILRLGRDNAVLDIGSHSAGGAWFQSVNRNSLSTNYNIFLNPNGGNILIGTTTDAGYKLDVNGDTILRRVTFITPNTITGGTEFFRVKSGNWPTSLIQGFENGVLNLGSSSGSIGFNTVNFSLPVGSFFSFNYVPANILNTYAFLLTANYTNVGAGGTSEGAMLRTTGSTATSVGNVTMNQIEMKPTYNNTGGTTINRGFYYNPTITSLTGTSHFAIHTTSGRVRFEGLPTSPTGLNAGDIYNDGGTLRIV